VRMLDLVELPRLAHPDWFAERKAAVEQHIKQTGGRRPLIMLAEDSSFFRKQVAGFLEDDGYEVVTCEDGLVAWKQLQSRKRQFDLIITDLEMPNMNGFQLSRKIKDDPELCHLPIIALTSLAGEDDMMHGKESGIDDYQIKLDRERLLTSVRDYLERTRQNDDADALYATAGTGRHS
jgi:two-component system chemotaxis sensor kinase CheA